MLQPQQPTLAFCLTVGSANVLLKSYGKTYPTGTFPLFYSPQWAFFLILPMLSHMLVSSPRQSRARCVNQSDCCPNFTFIYLHRKFRNVNVACLYLYPVQPMFFSIAATMSLHPPVLGMFNWVWIIGSNKSFLLATIQSTPVKCRSL